MKAPSYIPPKTAKASPDRVEKVRSALRQWRSLQKTKEDLSEQLKQTNISIRELEFQKLPDLFREAGIDKLGLPAEGNLPAYDSKLEPYYKANIAADWDPERRAAAFAALRKAKAGDLIKTVITIQLGLKTEALRKAILKALQALGLTSEHYTIEEAVPWKSLTSWVKDRIEKHKTIPPMETLGAEIGSIVKLKQRKDTSDGFLYEEQTQERD